MFTKRAKQGIFSKQKKRYERVTIKLSVDIHLIFFQAELQNGQFLSTFCKETKVLGFLSIRAVENQLLVRIWLIFQNLFMSCVFFVSTTILKCKSKVFSSC